MTIIKQTLKDLGLTEVVFARQTGYSRWSIQRFCSGKQITPGIVIRYLALRVWLRQKGIKDKKLPLYDNLEG